MMPDTLKHIAAALAVHAVALFVLLIGISFAHIAEPIRPVMTASIVDLSDWQPPSIDAVIEQPVQRPPTPEPAPPQPQPQSEPQPQAPPDDSAEIAQRQREAIARRRAEMAEAERIQREAEAELARIREQREAAEREREREQQRLAQLADQQRQDRQRQQQQLDAQRRQQLLDAEAQQGQQAALATKRQQYQAAIAAKVTRNWIRPTGTTGEVFCVVNINQIPGGEVVDVRLGTPCTVDEPTRRSIIAAVTRASPLPHRGFEDVFAPRVQFNFRTN